MENYYGCPYCKGQERLKNITQYSETATVAMKKIGGNAELLIAMQREFPFPEEINLIRFPISYCPICGAKLSEVDMKGYK